MSQAVALRSEVAPPRLEMLAATVRRHHGEVQAAMRRTLEHMIACGEALIEARELVPQGQWIRWLDQSGIHKTSAHLYIRIFEHREELELVGVDSWNRARDYLRENNLRSCPRYGPDVITRIFDLREQEGLSSRQIAERVGVSKQTVNVRLRGPRPKSRAVVTTGERPPKSSAPPEITDDMIEGMARWLAVRTGGRLTDEIRARATEALRVALNYKAARRSA